MYLVLLKSGKANTERKKSPNDAKRFIRTEYYTEDGELAQVKNFSLDQEARFDSFYCICTDLEGPAASGPTRRL